MWTWFRNPAVFSEPKHFQNSLKENGRRLDESKFGIVLGTIDIPADERGEEPSSMLAVSIGYIYFFNLKLKLKQLSDLGKQYISQTNAYVAGPQWKKQKIRAEFLLDLEFGNLNPRQIRNYCATIDVNVPLGPSRTAVASVCLTSVVEYNNVCIIVK